MKNYILSSVLILLSVVFAGVSGVSAQHDEMSKGVAGGGVLVKGWTGEIDAKEKTAGLTLNSAKLAEEGKAIHVTTGRR